MVTVTPPTNTGESLATGVSFAGAAHLHVDVEHRGHLLLGRVFMGHGPARLARHKAELALQVQAVDLVDHAVDVERQAVARLAYALVIRYQFHSALRSIHEG